MQKPDVDEIVGLSPAISIDQKSAGRNPRSTVATITEIYDYLRVLYARVGKPYCVECGEKIQKLSNEEIINFITTKVKKIDYKKVKSELMGVEYSEAEVHILSPIVRGRKGEYYQMLYDALGKGYTEVMIDGERKSLREQIVLDKNKKHEIGLIVDSITIDDFKDKNRTKDAMIRLSEAVERAIIESEGLVEIDILGEKTIMSNKFSCANCGFSFPEIEPRLFSFNSPYGACATCNGLGTKYFGGLDACEDCGGKRLRKEALNVFLDDTHKINIVDITDLTIAKAKEYFSTLPLTPKEMEIASVITKEIQSRLDFMLNVGLAYLQLNRKADTLSGGEAQRIRLASQLGSQLVGALYVLDEPTIGLHQKDNDLLIETLTTLRDIGNTIIVVEHDEDTIYASDYIVDIGPGAGVHGGHVVDSGYLEDLLTAPKNKSGSSTLAYLRGEKQIPVPNERRNREAGEIKVKGGNVFNIKNLDVKMPLGRFNVITGVSGSGKSSFMYEILHRNLMAQLERKQRSSKTFNCESFTGGEYLSRVVLIDQSPIGRTPRSNLIYVICSLSLRRLDCVGGKLAVFLLM
jgi:excinuclease ABC subunit A